MSWRINWKDGTVSYWPASAWKAEELVKLTKIAKFELITERKAKREQAAA